MQIAIIGASSSSCTEELYQFSVKLGQALGDLDIVVINGSRDGTMEAVFKGMHQSPNYKFGRTVGISPHQTKEGSNKYCDIVIPTGIGYTRNSIVSSSGDIVIALAGSSGTLSEIAFAWTWEKPILGLVGFGGWSEQLAGTAIDNRRGKDIIIPVKTVEEIVNFIKDFKK